jgi:hypothetical protein
MQECNEQMKQVISVFGHVGFRGGAVEVSILLECDATSLGTWLPTFRYDVFTSSSRVAMSILLGHFDSSLSRNVGNQLPSDAASHPWRGETSNILQPQTRLVHNDRLTQNWRVECSHVMSDAAVQAQPSCASGKGFGLKTVMKLCRLAEIVDSLLINEHNFQWQFILLRCVSESGEATAGI